MKKLVITTVIGTMLCGLTAFGQGYVNFTAARHTANNFFSTQGVLDTTFSGMDVALYVAITATNNGYTGAPLVESLENGVATNTVGSITWSVSQAWTDITTDPNFQLATDVLAGHSTITNPVTGFNGGSWTYKTGSAANVEMNTVAGILGGDGYEMYVIGWNSAYADPAAAMAAGSAVGWSQEFIYNTGATSGSTIIGTSPTVFAIVTVPEPATLALAGLGGMALLAFRRRKA